MFTKAIGDRCGLSDEGRGMSNKSFVKTGAMKHFDLAAITQYRSGGWAWLMGLLFLWASPSALADPIRELTTYVRSTESATARFEQRQYDAAGKLIPRSLSSGTLQMQRPGKFRWEVTKPYAQLLVADGTQLWVYDPDLKQVTVKPQAAALAGSPAAFLLGQGDLNQAFTLRALPPAQSLNWVEAIPKSRESTVQSLRVGLSGTDVSRMEFIDALGNKTVISFADFKRNVPIEAARFAFAPPAGVDVVGDR
jgi:outer membrane lipoprotein carrier protein